MSAMKKNKAFRDAVGEMFRQGAHLPKEGRSIPVQIHGGSIFPAKEMACGEAQRLACAPEEPRGGQCG